MVNSTQASLTSIDIPRNPSINSSIQGILIAFFVITTWASSLIFLLSLNLSDLKVWWLVPAIGWQTFLYTGLFITAHDAMHGAIFPQNIRINNFVGRIAVFLYALFPYKNLLRKHWQHHHNPASALDPDFHDGEYKNLFAWYFHFMKGYWNWLQLAGLIAVFHSISYIFHVPHRNLVFFWAIPAILSSFQLFFFGTFLPHREPKAGYKNIHHAQTAALPTFLSLITCYHFGYHEEHHEYPQAPWWDLPRIYRMKRGIS